jgi:hypothetical protein
VSYILLGFTISAYLSSLLSASDIVAVLSLLPIIALTHEALHLAALKMLRIEHVFSANGMFIGFRVKTNNVKSFIISALFPQAISMTLVALYSINRSYIVLSLALLHIAISIEDLGKAAKYLIIYYFS